MPPVSRPRGRKRRRDERVTATARLDVVTTDLEKAFLPGMTFRFRHARGGHARRPRGRCRRLAVRRMTGGKERAQAAQAPVGGAAGYGFPAVDRGSARARGARVLARTGGGEDAPSRKPAEPELPADFVALRRLDEIERMNLVEKGEIKTHYTLVVDALRTYIGEAVPDPRARSDDRRDPVGPPRGKAWRPATSSPFFARRTSSSSRSTDPEIAAAKGLIDTVRGIVARTAYRPLVAAPNRRIGRQSGPVKPATRSGPAPATESAARRGPANGSAGDRRGGIERNRCFVSRIPGVSSSPSARSRFSISSSRGKRKTAEHRVFLDSISLGEAGLEAAPWKKHGKTALRVLVLVLVAAAAARPQTGRSESSVKTEGIDIILVLDTSGSMQAQDFQPRNRLYVAKEVVKEFISKRNARPDRARGFLRAGAEPVPARRSITTFSSVSSTASISGCSRTERRSGVALATACNRLKDSNGEEPRRRPSHRRPEQHGDGLAGHRGEDREVARRQGVHGRRGDAGATRRSPWTTRCSAGGWSRCRSTSTRKRSRRSRNRPTASISARPTPRN